MADKDIEKYLKQTHDRVFENNRRWAEEKKKQDPNFFDLGLLNPWLRNIRDVYRLHEAELDTIKDEEARYDRLVELNVIEQCRNVIKTAAIQQSYAKNKFPIVHGWVFGFNDGLLKDLKIDHESMLHDIQKLYHLPDADF
ncbi:carbonic anhydrase [Colletotrichum spaethianum]|uniref:Carbonic anhydrase n=1 Tax=Colletotrichum spaethianum TaxID=700344 RepID=A0AA37URD4_9PEZI|nr:carbonic anhydrase [Colletotrichum spaethianum]GKT47823.1 carbonic anhydrase [Colletotrichum spaethianum]